VGAPEPTGRAAQAEARLQNFDALVAQERNAKLDDVQIHIPTATHLGDVVVEPRAAQGLRRPPAVDDLSFSLPRGGIVGVIGPTARARPRSFG
jgi:ABC-type uncharacterized transport system ATPase subunit